MSYNKVRNKEDKDMKECIKITLYFFFGIFFTTIAMFAWLGFETICM